MNKQKILLLIIIFLTVPCAFLAFQWKNEREQTDALEHMREELIIRSFHNLGSTLNNAAETLGIYKSDFTEREKVLFIQSIGKDSLSINQIGLELGNYLRPQIEGNVLIYEQHIWIIEDFLNEILQGNITDENVIRSVAGVMNEQCNLLSDMFFKEYIGAEGLDSGELKRIMYSIELINAEIRKISN
jgi:hypothetical protein